MAGQSTAPVISVVLTSHNRTQYLAESIESILAQSFSDFELLVVDDASDKEDTRDLVRKIAAGDRRVRLIALPGNLGLGGARNSGVAEARGDYIAFQDDDDVSVPQRLERQLAFLRQHPEYALVGGRKVVCDADLRPMQVGPPQEMLMQPVMPPLDSLLPLQSANADPAALIRRQCLLEAGGYRPWFRLLEDWDLTLRLQEKYPMASLPEPVLYYRMHSPEQMTRSPLLWCYTLAAFVCAHRRRSQNSEPIGDGVSARALLPLFGELPAPLQETLLDMQYRSLRDLLKQNRLAAAVEALDDLLAAQGLSASPKLSVGKALQRCRRQLNDRKALRRLGSIRRKMLWLCLRHLELGYWRSRPMTDPLPGSDN